MVSLWADHVAAARPVVLLLQTGVLCLWLIAGANLVNLVLIRTHGRLREMAVRQALGARPWHVTRQILTEMGFLSALGIVVGVALGAAGLRGLERTHLHLLPAGVSVGMGGRGAVVTALMDLALSATGTRGAGCRGRARPATGPTPVRS